MIRPAPQRGYILLPVIVVITLVAAIALLMTTESALESNTAATELDAQQAQYVAAAGLNHALWLVQQQGCGPHSDLTDEPLGSGKYSSKLTTDLGSTTGFTISVEQDSWIRDDLPTNNYAVDTAMHIRSDGGVTERPLLRYDLSSLAAKASILSAQAWFYVSNDHPNGPADIHLITADWNEADATWDSMGANLDDAVIASIPPQAAAGVWVPVNLTSQVQAWVNGEPNNGITLNTPSPGVHGDYASRESANPPYLEVIVGTPPTSPALLKAKGTLANGASRGISRVDVTLRQSPVSFSQIRLGPGAGKDVMLDSFYNTRNHGDHSLDLDNLGTLEHSLIQFGLGAIVHGAKILSARLELYHTVTAGTPTSPGADVFRVTRDWIEGSKSGSGTADGATWDTWDGVSNWTQAGGDSDVQPIASGPISAAVNDWESWEIGALVQGWVDGTVPNYGVLLKGTGDTEVSFASKEDADPSLRPKLSITYTCACGQVCVAPQGNGNILMVVVSPTVLVAEDQKAKDLFESWGYTVNVISESANQADYDAGFAANDVVFISETVNSNQVGAKTASAPIGVVSQDGDYNPDLGLASGSAHPVGDSINITDNSHYITQPFASGSLEIYTQAMEQLTSSGALNADQQQLADSGGLASLIALDKGAAMEGGGSAAGRRVMLPLGTRSRFDWDRLNANGRTLVHRALTWTASLKDGSCTSTIPLMFVVGDPAALTDEEKARQTLLESWCYAVKVIDDGEVQVEYDATAAIAAVAYISPGADQNQVGEKLKSNAIGVVNEHPGLHNVFGFSTVRYLSSINDPLDTDSDHYITAPFGGTAVTLYSSSQPSGGAVGTLAGGLEQPGTWSGGALSPLGGLVTLDTGAALAGGGSAAGRRVQMPWDNLTVAALTTDGRAILQRSLEWVAGASLLKEPIAHWKLDETSGPIAVDSINGYDGTLANGPQWQAGLLQGGLRFDGIDDTVDIGPESALDNLAGNRVTLTAWIYASSWGEGAYGRIVDKSNATFPTAGWAFELYGPIQGLLFQHAYSGGLGSWSTPANSIQLNTWHHVALVYNGSLAANDPEIYIDGVARTVTRSSSPSGTPTDDSAINFTIGNHAQSTVRTFDGTLDDIRLFDSLLSAAEIVELAIPPGPVAHWKLDETVGPAAVDSAGGHDGTWTNGPVPVAGALDGGLDLDGSNDYVDAGSFDVTGSGITLMAWFNAEAIATDDGRFVSKASGPNEADAWWQLSTTDSGSNRYLRMRIKAGGTTTTLADSSVNLSTGTWYLATATYDSATGAMRLYLDGVEVASTTHAVGGALDTNPAVPVALGANGTAERFFNGILDDVRIYNRALGASEIQGYYDASAPQPPGYTEVYEPWSAASDSAWEVVDLTPFGVPANAVVEVAVVHADAAKEQWGGVRAVGSALERRVLLHEPESGGVDSVTMHVQADAGGRIEHYTSRKATTSFVLLGYWTGVAYVELFEPFSAGAANSWISEGVDDEGLGPNQVAEVLMQNTNGSAERLAGVRAAGSSINRRFDLHEPESGGVDALTLMVETDAASTIEAYAEDTVDVEFYVLGYWSAPPGSFTELGGTSARSTPNAAWGIKDISSLGVPANSITQFVLSNDAIGAENTMGARAVGSTLDRFVDLQEAEAGGSDLATMHAHVDANTEVEWYSESGISGAFFYPVGAWLLSP